MKYPALTAVVLMAFACVSSAFGYSPIWNINGWDAGQLKGAGITVKTWKHDQIGEDPAFAWVQITYDTSTLGRDQNVLMTLHVRAEDGGTISATRAERKKDDPKSMVLLFAVRKENVGNSYVDILVPKLLAEGAERTPGSPGFGGYTIAMSRILELAGKQAAEKSAATGDK